MKRTLAILVLLAILPVAAFAADTQPNSTGSLFASLFQGCWTCGAFNTVGAIGLGFADKAFTLLADAMLALVGMAMALWLLYFAAKLFLPFGAPGSSHWNVGAAKLFKLLFVVAFLKSGTAFWDYVFTPVLSGGLSAASALATAADSYEGQFGDSESMPKGSGAVDYCNNPPPAPDNLAASPNTSTAFAALQQMDCPLSKIQSQYAKGILIGVSVIGQSSCSSGWFNFIPGSGAMADLAAGVILIILFGFGFLTFPFLLLDVLMRVVLVAVTAPLAVASTLFKPTAKIAQRSLWTLVQCGFTLMFGAAIAGIGKAMMAYILQQMATLPHGPKLRDWSDLTSALEQSCSANFHIDFSSAAFYMLCGTAMLMIFMMRRAGSLAAELTGVSGNVGATATGAAIVGAVANAAGSVGHMAAQYVMTKTAMSKAAQVTGNNSGTDNPSDRVSGNKKK